MLLSLFQPYPSNWQPCVETTNWFIKTKSPGWYLSQACIAPFFVIASCLITWGLHFLALVSSQNIYFGTGQLVAAGNCGQITSFIQVNLPYGTFAWWPLISWTQCMPIPISNATAKGPFEHKLNFYWNPSSHNDIAFARCSYVHNQIHQVQHFIDLKNHEIIQTLQELTWNDDHFSLMI